MLFGTLILHKIIGYGSELSLNTSPLHIKSLP